MKRGILQFVRVFCSTCLAPSPRQSYYFEDQLKNIQRQFFLAPNSVLEIRGRVYDTIVVMVNDKLITRPLTYKSQLQQFGYWNLENGKLNLGPNGFNNVHLELLVENWGRINYGNMTKYPQKKGIWEGEIYLNEHPLRNWFIYPLQFKIKWIEK